MAAELSPPVLFLFPFARPILNRIMMPTSHAHAALHRLQSMWNECRRMTRERGAAMVEYSLLIALIAIVALAAIQGFGQEVGDQFEGIDSNIIEGVENNPFDSGARIDTSGS